MHSRQQASSWHGAQTQEVAAARRRPGRLSGGRWGLWGGDCGQASSRRRRLALLTGGGNGQWGVIQTGGALITSAHLSLASPVYILSVSGAICPAADLANNDYITIIGVAKSTTSLELCIKASGVQAAGIV